RLEIARALLAQRSQPLARQREEAVVARLQRVRGERLEGVAELRLRLVEEGGLLREAARDLRGARVRGRLVVLRGAEPHLAALGALRGRQRLLRERVGARGGRGRLLLRGAQRDLARGARSGGARDPAEEARETGDGEDREQRRHERELHERPYYPP